MMKDKNVSICWVEGANPETEGQYFVALRYASGFGSYDVVNWNSETWELDPSAKVVGWVAMADFLKAVNAGWPESDKQTDLEFKQYHISKKRDSDIEDEWIESE
jgi:hypothetical protein